MQRVTINIREVQAVRTFAEAFLYVVSVASETSQTVVSPAIACTCSFRVIHAPSHKYALPSVAP